MKTLRMPLDPAAARPGPRRSISSEEIELYEGSPGAVKTARFEPREVKQVVVPVEKLAEL
jgi:hypothetical protein